MTRGIPVLDPEVHLKGATPEALVRALFRRTEPLPPGVGEPVAGRQVLEQEVPADQAGDGVPHLADGV